MTESTLETDYSPRLMLNIAQYNERISDHSPNAILTVTGRNERESDSSPEITVTIQENNELEIVIGYYDNGKFNDLITDEVSTKINVGDCASFFVTTKDDGKEIEIKVSFVDRASGKSLFSKTYKINELVGVKGGIGIISENCSEFDNLTIEYNT